MGDVRLAVGHRSARALRQCGCRPHRAACPPGEVRAARALQPQVEAARTHAARPVDPLTSQASPLPAHPDHSPAPLRSIQSWPSSCPSSPAFSLLLDGGIELESENALLKEENERLKQENERLRRDREAAPLHALALQRPEQQPAQPEQQPALQRPEQGRACGEEGSKEPGELELAPGPEPGLEELVVSLPSAPPLAAVLRLHLEDGGRVRARLGAGEAQGGARPRRRKSQRDKERQRQAVIIATAIVVGVLAITITRNPAKAKVAAASAAATITSLMSTYTRAK